MGYGGPVHHSFHAGWMHDLWHWVLVLRSLGIGYGAIIWWRTCFFQCSRVYAALGRMGHYCQGVFPSALQGHGADFWRDSIFLFDLFCHIFAGQRHSVQFFGIHHCAVSRTGPKNPESVSALDETWVLYPSDCRICFSFFNKINKNALIFLKIINIFD